MKRFYIIFEGLVQGVGFRYTFAKMAQNHGCTGWIENRLDEKVECEIQGNEFEISILLNELKNNTWIRIEDYYCKEISLKENENNFTIKR